MTTAPVAVAPVPAVAPRRRGPVVALVVGLVTAYRFTVGPLLAALFGGGCRFTPTCSAYLVDAVRTHGVPRGVRLGVSRVARCNPGSPCGHDPVPTVPLEK